MSNAWSDLGDTAAHAISNPVYSSPIPSVNAEYVYTQKFMQPRANFSPLTLNTASPLDSSYKLVEESPREDMGGGLCAWTRKYAQVPAQHIEAESVAYNFIGFSGVTGINVQTQSGRYRFSRSVMCKVQCDYFLIDGSTYIKPTDIPIIAEQRYFGIAGTNLETDYLASSPPFVTPSSPARDVYEGWITSDATGDNWHIVIEPSRLVRWLGNIWRRETRYIKAK